LNSSSSAEISGIRPFENDVEYLMAELEWVRARTRRIEMQKETTADHRTRSRVRYSNSPVSVSVCTQQIDCLLAEERDIRDRIRASLALGEGEGKIPGLVRMCRDLELGDFEKHILLLGMIPCLGSSAVEAHLLGLDSTYTSGLLFPEAVFEFLEMGYDDRIRALPLLLASGTIRREGLVQLCFEPTTPASVVGVGIELSGKAVASITGFPSLEGFSEVTK